MCTPEPVQVGGCLMLASRWSSEKVSTASLPVPHVSNSLQQCTKAMLQTEQVVTLKARHQFLEASLTS